MRNLKPAIICLVKTKTDLDHSLCFVTNLPELGSGRLSLPRVFRWESLFSGLEALGW